MLIEINMFPNSTFQSTAVVLFGKQGGFADINLQNNTMPAGFSGYNITTSSGYINAVNSIGDFNNDGYYDIAITSNKNTVYVLYGTNKSLGTINLSNFQGPGFVMNNLSTAHLSDKTCDYNKDGYDDIVMMDNRSMGYIVFGTEAIFQI